MVWNIFKKKDKDAPAAQTAAPDAKNAAKESIEQRIERELDSLPGPVKKQMSNPEVKARFIEIAKRMEADGVNFQSIKQMKRWIKDHEKELKEEQQNGPKNATVVKTEEEQIGRNEPCPCGSGKKFKKCCALKK